MRHVVQHTVFPAVATLAACLLAACQPAEPPTAQSAAPASEPAAAAASHVFDEAITAEDFLQHVKVLSSDDFGGRQPGTDGETKTVEYLIAQFKRLGIEPGNGDSYTQTVPMVETTATPVSAKVDLNGTPVEWSFGTQWVGGTRSGAPKVEVSGSPMVFVGYGVNAPEAGWNDYAGLDVKGKTVVMLINDPGFHVGDETLFGGKRMTYYGRWTYKFEEAARQGATAALIIHDTAGAGYPWSVVQDGWTGAQHDLPASEDPEPRLPLQGWISAESATELFAASGYTLEDLRTAANKKGFAPVPLKASLSVELESQVKSSQSNNVLGLIRGTEKPDEVVVYMGHWDHLGTQVAADGSQQIWHGAIDNASGIAGILEIAERFAKHPPKRSVLILPVTLEESGLLGSKYYVSHPTFPLANTVGVINIDAMSIIGPTRDMVVIGYGSSELEDVLKPIAEKQGRVLHAEADTEKGYFFRSDHFNFAKAGVPALYAKAGLDHAEKGIEAGRAIADEYTANRYHKPADVVDPNWDLRGVVQDLEAFYEIGSVLANGDAWPNWYEDNAFRATRDAQRSAASEGAK